MTVRNQFDDLQRAKELSNKGISLSKEVSVYQPHGVLDNPEKSGRPKANVFDERDIRRGRHLGDPTDIGNKRAVMLATHKIWSTRYDIRGKVWNGSVYSAPMPSLELKRRGNPIWTVYRVAEYAWILTGHNSPENRIKRPLGLYKRDTFVNETAAFWSFLNDNIERNAYKRRGPKPNAEQLFKTAVAAMAAKLIISPQGGNWKVLPSPRHVSQIWYVLFGESERHDVIKKKFPRLGWYCSRFPLESARSPLGEPHYYPVLGRAIERKYPK